MQVSTLSHNAHLPCVCGKVVLGADAVLTLEDLEFISKDIQ